MKSAFRLLFKSFYRCEFLFRAYHLKICQQLVLKCQSFWLFSVKIEDEFFHKSMNNHDK